MGVRDGLPARGAERALVARQFRRDLGDPGVRRDREAVERDGDEQAERD